jgi:hypothetical protein
VRGKISVLDGPFSEAKELVAGFWLIRTNTKQEAIEWAKRCPSSPDAPTNLELRPLYEMDDFPVDASEQPDGWREQEQRFREQTGAQDATAPAPAPIARKPGTKRYMVILRGDALSETGEKPSPATLERMGALMDEYTQSGAMLAGEGLKPSAEGARVIVQGRNQRVVDGPFSETKELIAGYTIIQVATRDEAITFAKRWLPVHIEAAGGRLDAAEIEVREVFEMEDFPVDPAEKPDGWRQKEIQMRERLGN